MPSLKLNETTLQTIKWDENGFVPAIVQDAESGHVLMMAYMTAEALQKTLDTGETVFYSRSRAALWHKGETSGHIQAVTGIYIDCDADTLLVLVNPAGPACHTNARSCFYRSLEEFQDKPVRE